MSIQCERQPQCEKQQQEYEFIMEGISTRMTMALEKMADSNRMMSESNRRLCHTMILVVIIVALAFLVNNVVMINHVNNIRSGVNAHETVPEQRPGAND
jgi:hypothetical protein